MAHSYMLHAVAGVALLSGVLGGPAWAKSPRRQQSTPTPENRSVHGVVAIFTIAKQNCDAKWCASSWTTKLATPGKQVVVRDDAGSIIATATLGVPTPGFRAFGEGTYCFCDYAFDVEVPLRPFYTFTVGNAQPFVSSRADLEAKSWRVELTYSQ